MRKWRSRFLRTATRLWNCAASCAAKVFARTAAYDAAIAAHLQKEFAADKNSLPQVLTISAPLAQPLRYGENPHQTAALYGKFHDFFKQLHGKELSYNNILDLTAAAALIAEFQNDPPTLAILKHTNPCGVGQGANLREAWDKAFATDKQAPFGGIIAVNQTLDGACAAAIAEIFSEVIVAPEFSAGSAGRFCRRKKICGCCKSRNARCPRSRGMCAAWARIRFCCSSAI